ncbi:MAG: hypothetical protein A2Y07_11110 [Planctomycetes bacterium GWF2_50_10]|nr:MAG: hypothetical protein A2Y07_11110 [Planctomycetes bacterium GWF2_50_10]
MKLIGIMVILAASLCAGAYDVNNVRFKGDSTNQVNSVFIDNGSFDVETAGGKFKFIAPNELQIYGGPGSNKLLLGAIIFDKIVKLEKAEDNNDNVLFWSEDFNLGIHCDSTIVIASKRQLNIKFKGDYAINASNNQLVEKKTGLTITNVGQIKNLNSKSVNTLTTSNQVTTVKIENVLAKVTVSVIPSYERVLQGDLDFAFSDKAEISAAKNETESFQIVVANKNSVDIGPVQFAFNDWKYVGNGQPGALPVIIAFREHYVPITKASHLLKSRLGNYPDALVPFINPYTGMPVSVAAVEINSKSSQGYWFDVSIPADAIAGQYSCLMSVRTNNQIIASIPVTLTVWDFQLPSEPSLKTYFGDIKDISWSHGLKTDTASYNLLVKQYQRMLRDHCIMTVFQKFPQKFDSTGAAIFTKQYLDELRAFKAEFSSFFFRVPGFYSTMANASKLPGYLKSYNELLIANPWIGTGYVYFDEPGTKEYYNEIIKYGEAIHKYAHKTIKLLVTEQIKPQESSWPSMAGSVDIWVPSWELADVKDIVDRQKAGDEVWSYSALTHPGVTNWLLDSSLLEYRIPAWFTYSLNLKGLLYWQTTAWARKDDSGKPTNVNPWANAATYEAGGKKWNGEGSLLYPGKYAGIDGPLASIRLKIIRDSIEDFEYFIMAQNRGDASCVRDVIKTVASSFNLYSVKAKDYVDARAELARMIIE